MDDQLLASDMEALREMMDERAALLEQYLGSEREKLETSYSDKAGTVSRWESLISDLRQSSWSEQLSSYGKLAGSMATLLGGSVKDQAKVMIPFEIAEATKEFARFLGTKDPTALASSLKHALAAQQYAKAAKSGGGSVAGYRTGGQGSAAETAPSNSDPETRQTRVVVDVGRNVGLIDTYDFARELIDAINENLSDDVILEVAS